MRHRWVHGELSNYNAEPQAARNRSMKKVRFLGFDVHAGAITVPWPSPTGGTIVKDNSTARKSTHKWGRELGPAEQLWNHRKLETRGDPETLYLLPTFSGRWNISISAASLSERRLRPQACAAPMKDLNSGCGSSGFDLNSGWNWQPMK
jgi:hypothetical protein